MKNFIYLIVTTIIFITLILIAITIHEQNNNYFKTITIQEYNEMETKQNEIIYITNSKYNQNELTEIIKIISEEYALDIIHFETKDISNEDFGEILSVVTIEKTPTLAFIKDGQEITEERITDIEITKEDIENKLEKLGYIKKD